MEELIKKIIREELEGGVDKPLSEKEIRLFKYLNKHKTEYPTQNKLLDFIKTMMPFIGRPESDARFYYEIYTSNYRPEGDYENLDKLSFKDYRSFKQRKTPNNTAYEYSSSKIPFKGSNLEGYWDVDNNHGWHYVVKSYGWYPIFLFKENKWFRVSDNYSSSTSKHLSNSNPVRYNSGLKANVYDVTRNEMDKLVRGNITFDKIKKDRVEEFDKPNINKNLLGKPRWITIGWGPEKKKVNFTVDKIYKQDGKITIEVTINKAGNVEGTNRVVINPDGYVVPSPFSEDIEKGIEYRFIKDNDIYLNDQNTNFVFNHPK